MRWAAELFFNRPLLFLSCIPFWGETLHYLWFGPGPFPMLFPVNLRW